MSHLVRFFCEECGVENRGEVVEPLLPLQILSSQFQHEPSCSSKASDYWIQVYEGEYDDPPPGLHDRETS